MDGENEFILKQAKILFQVELVEMNTMGGSGSKIFEVKKDNQLYILRATECVLEKVEHTAFELKWMAYLSDHLAGIVKPQKSIHHHFYEVIPVGKKDYILILLEKAPGKIVDVMNPNEFNKELFFHLGMLMGDMHRLTTTYEGNISQPEFEWTGLPNAYRYDNPILDKEVRCCQRNYFDTINRLPKDKDNYGIIHWDIHTDNFFVENGVIKLFDFDACQFNWYTADMASAIFFLLLKGASPLRKQSEEERTKFATSCIMAYLKGYLHTHSTSAYWIKKIDLFIKYQMCDEYLAAQSFWPDEDTKTRDEYLKWHRDRITNDLPYVFVDYDKIIKDLMIL